jgi:hypothetical protein
MNTSKPSPAGGATASARALPTVCKTCEGACERSKVAVAAAGEVVDML